MIEEKRMCFCYKEKGVVLLHWKREYMRERRRFKRGGYLSNLILEKEKESVVSKKIKKEKNEGI